MHATPVLPLPPFRPPTPAVRLWLIDGALLGFFMLSVAIVVGFMESPGSPLRQAVPSAGARHAIVGLAMGLTLIALVYSPWGGRSGASHKGEQRKMESVKSTK